MKSYIYLRCGIFKCLLELNLSTAVRNAEQSHQRQMRSILQHANFSAVQGARELIIRSTEHAQKNNYELADKLQLCMYAYM